MTIKIAAALPTDTRLNGLAGMRLVDNASEEVVVVMRMASTSVSHLFATEDDVFTLAIAEVEALHGTEAKQALELLAAARAERTGEYHLDEEAT